MIRGIHVKNFQSLREVSLSLGKLTVIVGPTNVGKSALMRALRALVENRRGESFIFDGARECQVSVATDTHTVVWYKPIKKSALYYIAQGQNQLSNVPQSTAIETLGIRKVELSRVVSLMLNFQNQLDPPFLLTESDVVKSKIIGEITNASLLLASINILKRWGSMNSGNLSVRLQDTANTKDKLVKYATIPKLKEDMKALTLRVLELNNFKAQLQSLEQLFETSTIASTTLTKYLAVHHKVFETSRQLAAGYFGSVEMPSDVDLLTKLSQFELRIEHEVAVGKVVRKKLDVINKLPDITAIEQLMQQMTVLAGYNDAIEQASSTISMLERESTATASLLKAADEDVVRIRTELKVCPLCNASLVDEANHEHAQ